jgi:hypothetical protein
MGASFFFFSFAFGNFLHLATSKAKEEYSLENSLENIYIFGQIYKEK